MLTQINSNEEDMKYLRLIDCPTGLRLMTYSKPIVTNVFVAGDHVTNDCMIHKDQKDFILALHNAHKSEDEISSTVVENYTVEYKEPIYKVDDLMNSAINSPKVGSFTFDFKQLERIYKSMKNKSNNVRIDVTEGDSPMLVFNEEGDVSLLSKIID